jgi:menaquinone-dependent protoporphyrinogen IX oxidase
MKAAILVESLTGNTWKAAESVANLLQQERWTITGLSKVKQPDHQSIHEADIVLVSLSRLFPGWSANVQNAAAFLPRIDGRLAMPLTFQGA